MADTCERCEASLDGPPNHLELELGAEHGGAADVILDLCDGCADVVAATALEAAAEPVVDLSNVYGEA